MMLTLKLVFLEEQSQVSQVFSEERISSYRRTNSIVFVKKRKGPGADL